MNEMMIALEAMIRRVVKEEMSAGQPAEVFIFRDAIKSYTDNHKHEFAALVSVGALDMPWFDEAIKAEVVANTGGPTTGYSFADQRAFANAVKEVVLMNGDIDDWYDDKFRDRLSDVSFSISVDR